MRQGALCEFALWLPLLALASCGRSGAEANRSQGGAGENITPSDHQLTSDAFQGGQAIPVRFTCDGGNESPMLRWSNPPAGTRSFALAMDDPDAPGGTFRHWGVYDIPASARSIGGPQALGTQVSNDFGKPGYGGPCPPKGHGAHHYHFMLFALDQERLGLPQSAKIADVENAARQHAIGEGELVAIYERK
jgi:Raf kinase inhibitor-like YbhB/YbcL family protein